MSPCPSFLSAIFFPALDTHIAPVHGLLTTRFVSTTQMKAFVSLCSRPRSFAHNQDSLFKCIKNSHRESVISINYFPPRASQGPCIEPDGQQSTPCGSTTVQRPMLTGKRVVGAVVKHLTQAGLPRSALSPTLSSSAPPKAV